MGSERVFSEKVVDGSINDEELIPSGKDPESNAAGRRGSDASATKSEEPLSLNKINQSEVESSMPVCCGIFDHTVCRHLSFTSLTKGTFELV